MQKKYIFLICILLLACCKEKEQPGQYCTSEMLIFDSTFTTTENDHGFFYFQPADTNCMNWTDPYDFYNGQFYYRYEIIDYPSDDTFMTSICIWADVEGSWESWEESCCYRVEITGKGVFTANSSPNSWWNMDDPVDFSRVDDFYRMGLVLWCEDRRNISDWVSSENSCWERRNYVLPLTIRLTVVAVANGSDFSGWKNY